MAVAVNSAVPFCGIVLDGGSMTNFLMVADSETEVVTPPLELSPPSPKRGRIPPPPALEQLSTNRVRMTLRI
jgi:hypothetical protein